MYDIYTMERPGRPWLAAALSAVILAGTLLFAWALVLHKQRALQVPLLEAQAVGTWPISIRPPEEWTPVPVRDAPPEVGLVLAEPGGDGRTLAVVRGPAMESALPPGYVAGAIDEIVMWLSGAEVVKRIAQEPARLGPLPGVQVQWLIGHRRRSMEQVLGCVSITPQGRVFAILLKCPGRPDRGDARFLEQIASSVEFPALAITQDVASEAAKCGLQFDAPPGVRATAEADGPFKTLQLISNPESSKPWTVQVSIAPLASRRTASGVLRDILRNVTEDPRPKAEVEPIKLNDREVFRVRFSAPDHPWDGETWAIPVAPHTIVVLEGRDEGPGSELGAACRRIAETARLTDKTDSVDVTAAQSRGEELLAQVREAGVERWFDEWAGTDQLYMIEREGQPEGYYRLEYSRVPGEPRETWRVGTELQRVLSDGHNVTYKREAQVDAKGVGYQMAEVRSVRTASRRSLGRLGESYRYQEGRAGNTSRVHKALTIGRQEYENTFTVGPGFACDPLLRIVYWLAAKDPERRTAVILSSDAFDADQAAQVLYPLGAQPVPGSEPPKKALAVVVQGDSVTYAYTFYFDDDGTMIRVDVGRRTVFQRCTEQELRERFSLVPGSTLSPTLIR